MRSFTSNPDRDAWKTIRGFVQQVYVTVQRWLVLPAGSALELECGEDIDHVTDAVAAAQVPERVLEQIKVSEKSVTLRSSASVEAFANFVEHRRLNPGVPLRVRITTTAARGKERPELFEKRQGIAVWEELASAANPQALTDAQKKDATTLRKALRRLTRPDGFNKDIWKQFVDFLRTSDGDAFHQYLRSIEWSQPVPGTLDMASVLRKRLLDGGQAADEAHASQLLDRLFMHVFRVLCNRGLKRLLSADLQTVIAQPTLSESDHRLLTVLRDTVEKLGPRVDALETAVTDIRQRQAIEASIVTTVDLPVLAPPLPAVPFCDREAALAALRGPAGPSPRWVHLHGSVGGGRSQLVLQWIGDRERCRVWLRCGEFDAQFAIRALEAVIGQFVTSGPPAERYAAFAAALGPAPVVVLADLPPFQKDDQLAIRLALIAERLAAVGGTLVTTAVSPLPTPLVAAFGAGMLHRPIPPFENAEVAAWLQAAGAPDRWAHEPFPRFVRLLGFAHGQLLAATIDHFARTGWTLLEDRLGELVQQQHVTEAKEAAQHLVMRRLPEAETRDLLYRLGLLGHAFTADQVGELAEVGPAIARPSERLHELRSLCVESGRPAGTLYVSPMFAGLGEHDVPAETKRRCHARAADWIVKARSMDVLGLLRALTHLVKAGQDDRAGSLLLVGVAEALEGPDNSATRLLASVWTDPKLPLPAGVSRSTKILLRAFQIVLRTRFGLDVTHLLAELDPLVSGAIDPADALAIVVAGTRVGIAFSDSDATIALRYTAAACRNAPHAKRADGKPFELPSKPPIELMPFVNTMGIRTIDHLALLLDAIESLPAEARHRTAWEPVAMEASLLAAQRVLTNAEEAGPTLAWPAFRTAIEALAGRAAALGQPVFAASCLAVSAQVLARREKNPDAAVALIEQHKTAFTAVGTLVLCQLGGDALLDARSQEAIAYLHLADAQPGNELPIQRMLAAAALSRASANDAKGESLRFARRALDWAQLDANEIEIARMMGELAIAQHLAGDAKGAVVSLSQLLRTISDDRGDPSLDQFLSPAGHLLAFVGTPIDAAAAPEAVPPPPRGAFFRAHAYTPTQAADERFGQVAGMLAWRASTQRQDDIAQAWARQVERWANERGDPKSLAHVSRLLVPAQIRERDWDTIVDYARAAEYVDGASLTGDGSRAPVTVQDVIAAGTAARKPEEITSSESRAAIRSLVPCLYALAPLLLSTPGDARHAFGELEAKCRDAASTAGAPWDTCADLFAALLRDDTAAREATNVLARDASKPRAIRVLAFQAGALLERADLVACLSAQLTALHAAETDFRNDPSVMHLCVYPAVEEFWRFQLRLQASAFSLPSNLADAVDTASGPSTAARARRLLKEVAVGLKAKLSTELSEWLES